jgi:tetratricopeptide (TPR) repeat protein
MMMRQILLTVAVLLVPQAAAAQKVRTYPKPTLEPVMAIAQVAELRDGDKVVGTAPRGEEFLVEKIEDDRYQVQWKGRSVWISRADVLPFGRAIEYFTEAIQRNPTAADYSGRCRLRYENGDFDGAFDDCNQVIGLDPTNGKAYRRRACLLQAKGKFDKALADFDTAVRLDPNDGYGYFYRGLFFHERGDSKRAIADFDDAIRLEPMEASAYYNRGNAWRLQGDLEKAIADFSAAIRLDPKDPTALAGAFSNRGLTWKKIGDLDKALADFDEAIRLDPANPTFFRNRALVECDRQP